MFETQAVYLLSSAQIPADKWWKAGPARSTP
jgi:hypothetical protein